jgi:dimethylhistidine N-methyltransferase
MRSQSTARQRRITEPDDVLDGLRAPRKQLPCRLLYDAHGAELFTRITTLDAYYPTRLELELLERHLPVIAHQVGPEARVIEPGSGEARKPRMLLHALERPTSYVAIDIAHEQLERSARALRSEFPKLEIQTLAVDYTHPFELPAPQHEWRRSLVFFPGSTIGNFEPGEARMFLAMLARVAGDDRMLLLGADSTRDPGLLERAYDDEHGVTAAFNKNVLAHLNRTRGATFELDHFDHRAVWSPAASRVEMQLVSNRRQLVRIDGEVVSFADGEPIVTEHCYKHAPEALQALLAAAGWRTRQIFTSARRPYRLWLCEPLAWLR